MYLPREEAECIHLSELEIYLRGKFINSIIVFFLKLEYMIIIISISLYFYYFYVYLSYQQHKISIISKMIYTALLNCYDLLPDTTM